MYDFHPLLTSFPIVLISLAVFSDLLYLYAKKQIWLQFNYIVLIFGFIFSLLAFLSGLIASSNLAALGGALPEDLIANHYSFAKLILFTYIPLILFRYLRFEQRVFQYLYYFFCLFQFILIAYTSNLGGNLVFKHGVGVTKTPQIENLGNE